MSRISLTQYLVERQREKGLIPGELRLLLEVVARACKRISYAVGKGALSDVLGEAGSDNVQGEAQKKLDVIANETLLEANEWGGHLAAMASEEMDNSYTIPNRYPKGEFLLLFDPLDGSSNIDVNVSIGTIFSVLKLPEGVKEPTDACFLQPGTRQLAAGYAVYGPSTLLVLTVGDGVACFTLDRETGSWWLTEDRMYVPADTKEFAINASNARHWHAPVQRYVADLNAGEIKWQVANGDAPDWVKNHPALKGVTLPRTGRYEHVGLLVTKTLLFAGEGSGLFAVPPGSGGPMLRAHDKLTGEIISEFKLPANQSGIPMSYMVNGRQFILVAVGAQGVPAEFVALAVN